MTITNICISAGAAKQQKPTVEKNVPSGFANFFKKPSDIASADVDTKTKKRGGRKSLEEKAKKLIEGMRTVLTN
jgi:hypothetical protein